MKIENRKEIVLKKYTDPLPDNTQETNEVVFNKMKEDLVVCLFVFYKTLCSLGLENVPAIVFRAKKIIWVIQIFFR